jgi:bacteriocin-like protein
MKTAIIIGSAMASFCVEKFGTTRMKEITKEELKSVNGIGESISNFFISNTRKSK